MQKKTIRRIAISALAAVGLTVALAACGATQKDATPAAAPTPAATGALAEIKKAGKIKVGLEGTYAPWGYHDESGKLVGIEKEIADLIAADLGVKAEFIETPWDSLIAGVDAKRYDIAINNIAPTAERKQKYDFSIPYADSQGRVAVRKDSPLKDLSEIKGHLAATSETSNFRKLVEARGAKIQVVTGFDEAIQQVINGRAELVANDYVTFTTYLKKHPNAPIRLLEGVLGSDATISSVLIAKNREDLKTEIDKSLKKHIDNGDLKRIYEKYVGNDITPKTR